MPFITKLDFSDNRQVKQNIETNTALSGGTTFGTPFSMLPTGPDPSASAVTSTSNGLVSTFSGNSATTVYSWYTPIMGLANTVLSAWTPSNSATTQNTGNLFSGATSTTTVDGNFVNLTYTGVSFDVAPIAMVDLGSGNYSGTVNTVTFQTLSAGTIDYTGRTIWVDVSGITRTDELIVQKNAFVGYVLMCVDNEGRVDFQPASAATTSATTYWSASTGLNSIVVKNFGSTAIGDRSVVEGYQSSADGDYSHASGFQTWVKDDYGYTEGNATTSAGLGAHAEGYKSVADGDYSHAQGYQTTANGTYSHTEGNQTTASGSTSHAEGLLTIASGQYSHSQGISTRATGISSHAEGAGTTASGATSHAEGSATKAGGDRSHAEGQGSIALGTASHAEGRQTTTIGDNSHTEGLLTTAIGQSSHAEGARTTAIGAYSHAEGESTTASTTYTHAEGYETIASGSASHAEGAQTTALGIQSHAEGGLTIAGGDYSHAEGFRTTASGFASHAGGSGTTAFGITSFVHGSGSTAVGHYSIVLGRGITGNTDDTTYVDKLNIKTVGAGPGATDIGVDANGNVVNQASDLRLKQNISTIENALDKVRALRGVKYQWKDTVSGGADFRIGFIAQEVNQVEPLLTFTDKKSEEQYMGVQYKDVTALLVEAVKELSSGTTVSNNVYLETQSIIAEDNNIDLNYGGNQQTAVNGGIRVINALGKDVNAEFLINDNGDWTTNNNLIPNGLVIPNYTPKTSSDASGLIGSITMDDNYIYVKTSKGWKRSSLENF
jgi:hypothetical protein